MQKSNSIIIILTLLFPLLLYSQTTRTLDFYLDEGVKNSPLLKDLSNQIKSAETDSLIITANQKPQVTLIGQVLIAPVYKGFGYDEAGTNRGAYIGMVNVSKLLANKKYVAAQYETLHLQNQSMTNTAKISEHDLKKSITDQYLIAYQDKKQLEAAEPVIDLLKRETVILKELAAEGMYKQGDLLSFTIELQTQEIAYEQLKVQYKSDLYSLNNLCGILDTSTVVIAPPNVLKHRDFSLELLPAFMKFYLDSLTNTNSKKLIDLNYRPQLSAVANAGLNAVPIVGVEQAYGFSIGLNFTMPLYDGHQRQLGYKKLEYAEDTRRNYKSFLSIQTKIQLQQLDESLRANASIKNLLSKQGTDIQTLLELNKIQLNEGSLSITDYTLNLKRLLDLQNDLNAAEIKELLLINSYNYIVW